MRIGIDLGCTKLESIALGEDGLVLACHRILTPQRNYAATVKSIRTLVEYLETEAGSEGTVGVGIPGTISPRTGLVKNTNSRCLIGEPLDRDLATVLQQPARIANDANCFILSETTDSSAAAATLAFGMILGTGVGSGIA